MSSPFISTTTSSNYTYNSTQVDQSNDSGLSAAYIGLIIALIGLASSCLIQYKIKTVKLCCMKFECKKKDEENEYTFEEHMVIVPQHMAIVPHNMIIVPDHMAIVPEHMAIVPEHMAIVPEHTTIIHTEPKVIENTFEETSF